jgi:osmotically-inducible protein OsmY
MSASNRVSDKTISEKVQQRMGRTGMGSGSRVTVLVRSGDVTLAGILQYEIQRNHALTAARGVTGVRRVIDQMSLKPQPHKWDRKK